MPGYYQLRLSPEPDTVIIDDGLAPFQMSRAELEHGIYTLKRNRSRINPDDYNSLMRTYEDALKFLKEGAA